MRARSRVTHARVRRVEDVQRRNLTIVGSVFLLFALVCLSIVMLLKALPSWVLPESDSVYVLLPHDYSREGAFWLIVNRPAHRGSLLIKVPYSPNAPLSTGIFPTVPMQTWAHLANGPADTSQALGVTVDEVVELPATLEERSELLSLARAHAWEDVRAGQFASTWLVLAASVQNGTVVTLDSIEALPTVLDRNDVAMLGDINACHIAVLNDTQQNGLAAAVGQVIEQSGGQVIRLESATALTLDSLRDENDTRIQLLIRPEKKSDCANARNRVTRMFSQTVPQENEAIPNRLRADLVLVLGEEIQDEALFATASEQYLLK